MKTRCFEVVVLLLISIVTTAIAQSPELQGPILFVEEMAYESSV